MVNDSSSSGRALLAGGLAALPASTCCLGPLVLVALGFGGAWIGNLVALEPYRPLFIGVAVAAMYFASRRVFEPAQDGRPGKACASPPGAPNPQDHLLGRFRTGARRARISSRPSLLPLTRNSP